MTPVEAAVLLVVSLVVVVLVPVVLLVWTGRRRSNEGAHADPLGNRDIGAAGPPLHSQRGLGDPGGGGGTGGQ